MKEQHIPVLLNESISYLISDRNGIYFDGTLGFGGHSSNFLKHLTQNGKLIATEVDMIAYNYCQSKFSGDNRIKLYNSNFSQIDLISKIEFVNEYDGIFADLGVSSYQLDDPSAGFTYREDSSLDLRLDKNLKLSAVDIVNSYSKEELQNILFEYGEEKNSRKISDKIIEKRVLRKISTTGDLVEIIKEITPERFLNKTLSRVFQALRIYVNNELAVLKEFLDKSINLLKKGGNIVILSYHSLEDRIIKETFKQESLSCVCPPEFPVCVCGKVKRLELMTKKPVLPSENEISLNRRSRSAKLRAAKRV